MAAFPPELQQSKRDYPPITFGVVVAILLVALLALPFLTRARPHRQTISSAHATKSGGGAIAR